ncbi:hypothetical protein J18TS1_19280 [Oceanobacillus oncorhynchi subsp. incaldanensis]|uniref:Uncharacterized protein n=1 Tax=Oceanobacillus aidingensis TaxID=645964 RepID=A0ABV9JWC3_9BACI|nr:hypothetical protein [Oceanobacillus oncorhynchi]GIO18828.1 hypothetical protein J18TS1_19280 [Oceanobacillus oncorhynchi subsp. incaldanensis]
MSSYQEFLQEKQLVDAWMKNNYKIKSIVGTLDGDRVELEKESVPEKQSILLENADSRKYITTLLIKHQLQEQ